MNIQKNTKNHEENWEFRFFMCLVIFEFYMASRRPGRYLETFLEPVASFSQSMSPYRATPTPFTPKIMPFPRPTPSVNRPISSDGPFYYGSISPSTVLRILGTPLDLCATPWRVDIFITQNETHSGESSYAIFRRQTYQQIKNTFSPVFLRIFYMGSAAWAEPY